MHVSVTVLGAEAGDAKRAASHIVGYLEGNQDGRASAVSDSRSRAGSVGIDTATTMAGLPSSGPAGYYADSAEGAGR